MKTFGLVLKKIFFFIPVISTLAVCAFLTFTGSFNSIVPITWLLLAFEIAASVLLALNKFFGGFFALVPGLYWIISSFQKAQFSAGVIPEWPAGVIIILFYAICSLWVYKSSKKAK